MAKTSERRKKSEAQPAAKPQAPAMTEWDALERLRTETGGILIPPPQPMTVQDVRVWLTAIANKGSSLDVDMCWSTKVTAPEIKKELFDHYQKMRQQADRVNHERWKRAERERREQQVLNQAAKHKDALVKKCSALESELASTRAELASLQ